MGDYEGAILTWRPEKDGGNEEFPGDMAEPKAEMEVRRKRRGRPPTGATHISGGKVEKPLATATLDDLSHLNYRAT